MAISVMTNHSAQESLRYLEKNTRKNSNVLEQLASGKRINRAADDPTGAAISSVMKKNMVGTRQAARNALEASSILQMMDSSLGVLGEKLVRIKELSLQAATDTVSDKQRELIDIETREILTEMDAVVSGARFNDIKLLDGSSPKLEFLVGLHNNAVGNLTLNLRDYESGTKRLGIADMKNNTKQSSQNNIDKINFALKVVNGNRASVGAVQSSLEKIQSQLSKGADEIERSKSQIVDADFANKTAEMVKGRIIADFNAGYLIKSNMKHSLALKLIT